LEQGDQGRLVDVVHTHVQKSLTSSPDSRVVQVGDVRPMSMAHVLIAVVRREESEEIVGTCCVTAMFINIMTVPKVLTDTFTGLTSAGD
jgi:hypothetical protein